MAGSNKGGKKHRKHGRGSRTPSSKIYKANRKWESNKLKKIAKHLKKQPNDEQSKAALKTLKKSLGQG